MCVGGGVRGAVSMAMKCLYFSCRMVTSSQEDSGLEACNWAKSSLRSAEQTTTHDSIGCFDLILRSNVPLVVVREHTICPCFVICVEQHEYQTWRITVQ